MSRERSWRREEELESNECLRRTASSPALRRLEGRTANDRGHGRFARWRRTQRAVLQLVVVARDCHRLGVCSLARIPAAERQAARPSCKEGITGRGRHSVGSRWVAVTLQPGPASPPLFLPHDWPTMPVRGFQMWRIAQPPLHRAIYLSGQPSVGGKLGSLGAVRSIIRKSGAGSRWLCNRLEAGWSRHE